MADIIGPRLSGLAAGGLRRPVAPGVQAGGGEGLAEGSLFIEADRALTPSSRWLVALGPVRRVASKTVWRLSGCLSAGGKPPFGTTTFFLSSDGKASGGILGGENWGNCLGGEPFD